MLCYRPEKWDELDPHTIARIEGDGKLASMLCNVRSLLLSAWKMLDDHNIRVLSAEDYSSPAHPLNCFYELAWAYNHQAFGLYNAMLIYTNDEPEIHADIYRVGHYSWFY